MMNLIKAEWYQLTQRKVTRGWFIAAIVLTLLVIIIPDIVASLSNVNVLTTDIKLVMYKEMVINTAPFLLLAIISVAFNNELKNRTLINSISFGYARKHIYLAKLIGSAIMAMLFVLLSIVTFCLVTPIVSGGSPIELASELSGLIHYLPIWLAFLGCYVWLSFLSESNTPSYIALVVLFFVIPLIFQLGKAFNISWLVALEPYMLTQLRPDSPITLFGLNGVPFVSLAYLIAFSALGIYQLNKKEI